LVSGGRGGQFGELVRQALCCVYYPYELFGGDQLVTRDILASGVGMEAMGVFVWDFDQYEVATRIHAQ